MSDPYQLHYVGQSSQHAKTLLATMQAPDAIRAKLNELLDAATHEGETRVQVRPGRRGPELFVGPRDAAPAPQPSASAEDTAN